jgi:hypothetical protein
MFREFTRCSRAGFALSVAIGAIIILTSASLSVATGTMLILKAGLVLGLAGARLSEAVYSNSCPWSRAGLESMVLALVGVLLVVADDLALGMLA